MKVILNQPVPNVGQKGQVVEVPDGYARNFLLPKKLATIATAGTVQSVVHAEAKRQQERLDSLANARLLLDRLRPVQITLAAKAAANGSLFGSVKPDAIRVALKKQGFEVPLQAIKLSAPIEKTGVSVVPIVIPDVGSSNIQLTIVAEGTHG